MNVFVWTIFWVAAAAGVGSVPLPDDSAITQSAKSGEGRSSRQSVTVLSDYDERYDLNNERPLFTPENAPVPKKPKAPRRRGIGGFISTMLNSSSRENVKAGEGRDEEEAAGRRRIRRQTQITVKLEEPKKSSKQEDFETQDADAPESDEEDEPPGGGDGQGGGLLGALAGLSGGDGESDLGTLLTTVASIVTSLSGGEGFDLNVLLGSAVALLAGILGGNGDLAIGAAIGRYLNTVFNGITGGGAMNNGAFIGDFLATVVAGSSGAGDYDGSGSEESAGGSDSGTFFASLLGALFSGSSSGR